jgi:hypothetical protein
LLDRLESYLVGIVLEFRRLLGNFKVENLSFFVSFDEVVASMEFIFYDGFAVLSPQAFGVGLFGLFWVHLANHFLPLGDGVSLCSIGVDQDHDTTLSAHHVSENILKVGLVFMLVEEVDDFLFEQFPLHHILDGQLIALLDDAHHLFQSLGLEDGVRLDDGQGEG